MRRIIDALYRVHSLISAITDRDALLVRMLEESKQVARAEACSLLLYEARTNELFFHVALGEKGDQQTLKEDIRLRMGQGIAGQAALTRQTINVADVRKDERFFGQADKMTQFETRSVLAVPLLDHDNLIGVIEVINKAGGGSFTEVDCHVLEMFSSLAATIIRNARLIEENLKAERLAAIGQAVAGLSHYTKNLVMGLSGSVDLIDQGLEQDNMQFLKKSWPIYKRSTKRVSNFVEDMLAYSKERKPRRESCDISQLMEDVATTFRDLLTAKRVELCIDSTNADRPVHIDTTGIHRCLLNLLTNAADAAPAEKGRIWMSARLLDDGALDLTVADNGPGVDPGDADRIFEPFFSTKGSQGTGLGLAVTKKIVTEHDGTISVERGEQGGALFRIVLPGVMKK